MPKIPPLPRGNGYAVSRDLHPRLIDLGRLRPLGRNTRKHPPAHIRKLKASLEQVPAVTLSGLREAELRTLRLALNRLGEDSSWDMDMLALEFSDILELEGDIDLQISGFEVGEIEGLLDGNSAEDEHEIPAVDENS